MQPPRSRPPADPWQHFAAAVLIAMTPPAALAQAVANADYPADALKAYEQGDVSFHVDIAATGAVENCAIIASSGSVSLDAATCKLVRSHARYTPARSPDGSPIRSSRHGTVHWRIPTTAGGALPLEPLESFPVTLSKKDFALVRSRTHPTMASLDVDEAGTLVGCRLLEATGSPKLDLAICDRVRKYGVFEPALDEQGRPKRATILQPITFNTKL